MHPCLKSIGLGTTTLLLFLYGRAENLLLAETTLKIADTAAQAQTTDPTSLESILSGKLKAASLYQQGVQQLEKGLLKEALQTFQQLLDISKSIGDRKGVADSLDYIGWVYDDLGQYTEALESYQQALTIYKELGDRNSQGKTLNNIGVVYLHLGQSKKAVEFYMQALAIHRELGDRQTEGVTLHNIAFLYDRAGQYTQSLEFNQQALVILREVGDKAGQAKTLNNIGLAYLALRQYTQALDFFQQALTIRREVSDRLGEGVTLQNIGEVYKYLGQEQQALDFYQQALAIHQQVGNRYFEGLAFNSMGEALFKFGKFARATEILFAGIEVWESMRPGLTDSNKISIFETQMGTYNRLQMSLIAQNKFNSALEISERSRARAFVDLLALRLSQNSQSPPTIKPPTIEQIQQVAKSQNATLVEYSIIFDSLYIWVIKPTGEVAFKQVDLKSVKGTLKDIITSSRDSIGVRGRGIAVSPRANSTSQTKQLRELYQILIQPIVDFLPKDPNARIIFIPQEELFLVPFPALQDESGKYLIQQHTILTAPAIQVLELTHQQRQRVSGKDLLVVGNPTMPSIPPEAGQPPQQLPSLPGAEKEALAIARILNTKAIIGKDATKAAILQKLASAKIIHLATHGLLDDFNGLGVPGAVALAPAGNDNGLLTASEIFDLKFNAELVVLSACDTGRGRVTGDGVIGLSRSLISAGVPSVLVSLWSVPDTPTASLMTEFYQNLQKQPDKAQALRQAMLKIMKQHANPRDWAAFTLIGEAQ